jgi:cytochrome c5
MTMKKVLYLSMLVFVVACAAKKTTQTPPSAAAPESVAESTKPAITTMNELSPANFKSHDPSLNYADFIKGKMLYETKCNQCHGLKAIDSQTMEGWDHEVTEMVAKYNKKINNELDANAERLIKNYVFTELQKLGK